MDKTTLYLDKEQVAEILDSWVEEAYGVNIKIASFESSRLEDGSPIFKGVLLVIGPADE